MFAGLCSPRKLADAALLELARTFTPRVEGSGDCVVLDLRGLGRMWPSAHALAEVLWDAAVAQDLQDLHIVLAPTRIGALLVARGRAGRHVIAEADLAAALAPLSIELLDIPEESRQTLRRWGIRTLGALAALPTAGLVARLGVVAGRWQRAARGEDDRPLEPTAKAEALEIRLDLDWPLDGLEPLAFVVGPLLEQLAGKLEQRGQQATELHVELTLVDRRVILRSLRTAVPTLDPRTWRTLLLLELESHPPPEAIQAIAVAASSCPARKTQFSLLEVASPSPERLSDTLARLSEWTRDGRAGSPSLLSTYRPGAFVMSGFDAGASAPAALPPSRRGPQVVLRAFRPPRLVEVRQEGGKPTAVVGAGLRAQVVGCAGPWRASGDWWDTTWSREEWDVDLGPHGLYRIFRDRIREAWFIEGELD